ncbi:hypothetical protein C8F04DRAFT_1250798 [Mycena alexandri]|uniref:RING-type domain-containing protein n=1 Tax=Mycena alexandri TaxID=1745969 RepID=A0AAD6TFF2_9AGAR|nr:hypothetical protein C8F04DRAFT_1250798 [Mycena alexandri]
MNTPASVKDTAASIRHPTSLLHGKTPQEVERIRCAIGNSTTSPTTRRLIDRSRQLRGHRVPRDNPLTDEELYLDAHRPTPLQTTRHYQTCSICLSVKVHPVAYLCGHSHCYVCVRLHLEHDWTCPDLSCRRLMHRAPHRHYPEEEGLEHDFAERVNLSRVSYSWEGLTFPTAPLDLELFEYSD